jgi:peptidoglycan hydrolase CwlO-like protein
MDFWEKIKSDIRKGMREGIVKVKEGVNVAKAKAEELTEEGKRRLNIFETKTKVQKEISELGGRIYSLSQKVKNPMADKKVNAIISRIKKYEMQLAKLEGKQKVSSKRTPRKRTSVPKSK